MRKLILPIIAIVLVSCGNDPSKKEYKLETFEQKLSYGIGYDISKNLKQMELDIDRELLYKGILDGLDSGTTALLTNDEMMAVFKEFQQKQMDKQQKAMDQESAPNRADGQAYMEKLKAEDPGYKVTQSGLMYKVIKEGKGNKPTIESVVKVKYKGTTISGEVFDQNESTSFPLNGVIQGWQEGLQLMTPGSNYMLVIPADLAYGNNPPPGTPIKAGSTLIFDVTLLEIEK